MATKKQKREAGEARQAANREESLRIGRAALERDRQNREALAEGAKSEYKRQQASEYIKQMAGAL